MKSLTWSNNLIVALGALLAAGVAVLALVAASQAWIDYLWFDSLGQSGVFSATIASQLAVWTLSALVGFVALRWAASSAWKIVSDRPRFGWLTSLACFALAGTMALTMSQQWMIFRLAAARAPFGLTDPQFGLDAGFFVFLLPALEALFSWVSGVIILMLVEVVVIVAISSRLDTTGAVAARWWQLKRILSVLAGMLMASVAFNFVTLAWRIVLSARTQVAGASYADVHAQLPAYWVLAGLSAILALLLLATASRRSLRPAIGGFLVWGVAALLLSSAWPALVQNYVVTPNEATAEAPYIERNIAMTRRAFDLESVATTEYPALESLSATDAPAAAGTLADAPIWTPSSVKQAFTQLQTIRPYYRLSPIDYDRYRVDGASPEQVLVAARQINPSGLPSQARTWVNTHLVYTHGFGLAISSASKTSASGFPVFYAGDVPPRVSVTSTSSADELRLTEPRIYFGSRDPGYAIVNTAIDEFDYPVAEKTVTNRYASQAGVDIGSLPRRIAWALRLRSTQLLFSGYVKPDSRVLVYRDVRKRAAKLAPWLSYSKPYSAIVDGRVVWIVDAYTSSDHFPYAQPLADGTNYLRNSVKVTVDALSGETTFYASGDDPIRDAWGRIFPTLITPAEQMPAQLAQHLRVSKRMFSAQSQVYRTYHMTDAMAFYNKEDLWAVPKGANGKPIGARYLTMALPAAGDGSAASAMYLLQPFASPGRDNLVGWMAVACDPGSYGAKTAYLLPKERVTLGQQQVGARINQDPRISQQLTLWNQPGSSIIFGDMLVLPVQGSVAYIQPVFLQAQNSAITELVSVVAANRDKVEVDRTLNGVLDRLYSDGATR